MVVAVRPVQFSPTAPPSPIRVNGEIPQNGGGVIDGFVRRQNSEDPIGDVQVTLSGGPPNGAAGTIGQRRATTDGNGRFAFRDLPAGRYTIDLERDGYFRHSLKRGSDGDLTAGERSAGSVVLGGGRSAITVVLSMVRGGTISGRILDPSGRPAVAVSVSAARVSYQDGRPSMGPAKSAMSDDRGEYRLYWLEPGEYFVLADKTLASGSVRSYFPGGDGASALKVKVTEGAESAKIDFSLGSAQTTVSISGTVTSRVAGFETVGPPPPGTNQATPRDSRVVPDVQESQARLTQQFYLLPVDEGRMYDGFAAFSNALTSGQDGAQGNFELRHVRSGSYELYAVFQDRSVSPARSFVAHTTIDVGVQDLTGIALTITPGIDLSGTVKVNGRNPSTPIHVQLRPKVALPNWTGLAVVSPDGSFAIPNVPEGQYRISIDSPDPNSYVAELFQGRNSIVDRGIVSVVRGLPETIEAVLQSPAAAIRGTVLASEEQLAAGVVITLVPEEDRRENFALFKRSIVGVDGAFSFGGVSPGRYTLFAWDRIPDGAEQNAEFMDAYNDKGTEIVATIGNTSSVELRLNSK
jgi:sarcosine oxidase gamma subunit